LPPPSYGGGGPQGRRGKATDEMSGNFRSETFENFSVALPLPALPRMTGEEEE
jgi:hypothetical protein